MSCLGEKEANLTSSTTLNRKAGFIKLGLGLAKITLFLILYTVFIRGSQGVHLLTAASSAAFFKEGSAFTETNLPLHLNTDNSPTGIKKEHK